MKYKNQIINFMAGACYALSFPFIKKYTAFPLIFISAAIFLNIIFSNEERLWEKIKNILIFLWGYNTVGYYWLNFTLFEFGGLFPPLNILFWQLFTIIISPHILLFVIFVHYFKKHIPVKILSTSLIFIFCIFEYFIPQQFPAHFGHPWLVLAPYIKPAQFFGAPFYSFLTLMIGNSLLNFYKTKKFNHQSVYISAALLIFTISVGRISIKYKENTAPIKTRIVQANIGNDLKLKSESGMQLAVEEVIETYQSLSAKQSETLTIENFDFIIWPETSFPRVLSTNFFKGIPLELKTSAARTRANMLVGTYDLAHQRSDFFEQQYNTAISINRELEIDKTYHKRVLIPFGEGLPFGPLNRHIAPLIRNISFFAKGEKFESFKVFSENYIPLICYEVLFPSYVRDFLNSTQDKTDFMVNLTNDSWYGPYSEQEQHLFLAKWRSIEFHIPLIRATNTGISMAMIPNGVELIRSENFVQSNIDFIFRPIVRGPTFYQKFGIFSFLLLGLLIIGIEFILKNLLSKGRAS